MAGEEHDAAHEGQDGDECIDQVAPFAAPLGPDEQREQANDGQDDAAQRRQFGLQQGAQLEAPAQGLFAADPDRAERIEALRDAFDAQQDFARQGLAGARFAEVHPQRRTVGIPHRPLGPGLVQQAPVAIDCDQAVDLQARHVQRQRAIARLQCIGAQAHPGDAARRAARRRQFVG